MLFNSYFSQLIQWVNYSVSCVTSPIETHGCAWFWVVCYLILVCLCSAIFLYAIRNVLRDRAALKAYEKRKIERAKVADSDVMDKVRWQTEDRYDEIGQSDLAEKMRQQLNKVKEIK
jgi:G:T-mismatch repair DNA endonuclease (very short patch repair protein)